MLVLIVTYYVTIGGQTLIDRQPPIKQTDRAQCEAGRDAIHRAPQADGVRVTAHCAPRSE